MVQPAYRTPRLASAGNCRCDPPSPLHCFRVVFVCFCSRMIIRWRIEFIVPSIVFLVLCSFFFVSLAIFLSSLNQLTHRLRRSLCASPPPQDYSLSPRISCTTLPYAVFSRALSLVRVYDVVSSRTTIGLTTRSLPPGRQGRQRIPAQHKGNATTTLHTVW